MLWNLLNIIKSIFERRPIPGNSGHEQRGIGNGPIPDESDGFIFSDEGSLQEQVEKKDVEAKEKVILTPIRLLEICPVSIRSKLNLQDICDEFNRIFNIQVDDSTDINTLNRVSGFIAQCAHESGEFRFLEENLNYSAEGLVKTFPRHFPNIESALEYTRKPQKIADKVYANRMNNGSEASGDGWRFRGRGFIQLTGRWNYTRCAQGIHVDIVKDPDYLLTIRGATDSAYWFWTTNKRLNESADKDNIVLMTRIVNGGTNGLEHRTKIYEKAKEVLGELWEK